MKFLGASIFKSDDFHIILFCFIYVAFSFQWENKPKEMLCQGRGGVLS